MDMKKIKLRFIDSNGKVLLDKSLIGTPLKDYVIIDKSIEFFDDPEPCMIHRSAVMKRLFMELCEYFDAQLPGGTGKLAWNEADETLRGYIDIKGDVQTIEVYYK